MRTLLSAGNRIKAASLWAPAVASTYEKALHYGRTRFKSEVVTPQVMQSYLGSVGSAYGIESGTVDHSMTAELVSKLASIDSVNFIDQISTPVIVQHAEGDNSVPFQWSESLVAKLAAAGADFEFYAYPSDKHLFKNDNFKQAIKRDITFFRKHMTE